MATTHFGWTTPFAFADTAPGALAADQPPAPTTEEQGSNGTPALSQALHFDHAMALLEAGEWSHAFTTLGALADHGHPAAARMALMLASRGTALFGGHFPASRRERERWQRFSA